MEGCLCDFRNCETLHSAFTFERIISQLFWSLKPMNANVSNHGHHFPYLGLPAQSPDRLGPNTSPRCLQHQTGGCCKMGTWKKYGDGPKPSGATGMGGDEDPQQRRVCCWFTKVSVSMFENCWMLSLSSCPGGSMQIFHAACVGQAPFPGFQSLLGSLEPGLRSCASERSSRHLRGHNKNPTAWCIRDT